VKVVMKGKEANRNIMRDMINVRYVRQISKRIPKLRRLSNGA
jgi:hypothetical protein